MKMKTLTRMHPLGPVNLLMVSVMKTRSDTQAPLTATTTMNHDYIVELISVISQKTDLYDSAGVLKGNCSQVVPLLQQYARCHRQTHYRRNIIFAQYNLKYHLSDHK